MIFAAVTAALLAAAPPSALTDTRPVGPPQPTVSATEAAKNLRNLPPLGISTAAVLSCEKSGDGIQVVNTSKVTVADGSTLNVTAVTKAGTSHAVFTTPKIGPQTAYKPVYNNPNLLSCTAKITA